MQTNRQKAALSLQQQKNQEARKYFDSIWYSNRPYKGHFYQFTELCVYFSFSDANQKYTHKPTNWKTIRLMKNDLNITNSCYHIFVHLQNRTIFAPIS